MKMLITAFIFSGFFAAQTPLPRTLEVRQGAASFEVATNMPAVTVNGKSEELRASVQARQEERQLVLKGIDAQVDARSLSTGMDLRDRHMREKVFSAGDDTLPALRFVAKHAACPLEGAGKETTCQVQGTFFVRGVGKPFRVLLKIKAVEKDGGAFRVSGDGSLKLSEYGIERPSRLGVLVDDEVRVRVEFVAKGSGQVT